VPALGERLVALVPTIPSYVWLAMILLAASLLGVTTMARARGQWQKAQSAHQATASRLQQAKTANAELKARTNLLRQNSRAAAQAAQEQLHHVRPNEIVIATR
jgi:cell division protein FtsB